MFVQVTINHRWKFFFRVIKFDSIFYRKFSFFHNQKFDYELYWDANLPRKFDPNFG